MGFVAIAGIRLGIGSDAGAGMAVASLGQRLGVVRRPAILRLLAVSLFWAVGAFTAYPYIAPYLTAVIGFGPTGISATVSMWGLAAALGVTVGGTLNDRFGSDRVVRGSLVALLISFASLAAATLLPPPEALAVALAAVAAWGFSVWSLFPAQMARLIAAGPVSEASVALALNTSTMYLGFSIGSAIGAGIVGLGLIWGIGVVAALSELVALALDRRVKGRAMQ